MLELDARKMLSAASATAVAAPAGVIPVTGPRELSHEAQEVASKPTVPAYSPIVLAGSVRLAECALVMLVGLAVYLGYVVPRDGFAWYYIGAIGGIANGDAGLEREVVDSHGARHVPAGGSICRQRFVKCVQQPFTHAQSITRRMRAHAGA